jgi:hypothetical protein
MKQLFVLLFLCPFALGLEECDPFRLLNADCTCAGNTCVREDQICNPAVGCEDAPTTCILPPFHDTHEIMRKCACGASLTGPVCVANQRCSFCNPSDAGTCPEGADDYEFGCTAAPPSCGDSQALMVPAAAECTCGVGGYPFGNATLSVDDHGVTFASRCHQQVAHGHASSRDMDPCDPDSATVCKEGEMCHLGSRLCYADQTELFKMICRDLSLKYGGCTSVLILPPNLFTYTESAVSASKNHLRMEYQQMGCCSYE